MGLIKKYHQKIISFSFILLGLFFVAIFFITRPSKTNVAEVHKYISKSELTNVSFPYSIKVPALPTKVDYLALYLGDDSLNEHDYKIPASTDSDILFERTYTNEASNIIVLTLDATKNYEGKDIDINITCENKCKDVKFALYETDTERLPKVTVSTTSSDYRYLWFACLFVIFGLTLLPLSKEAKK